MAGLFGTVQAKGVRLVPGSENKSNVRIANVSEQQSKGHREPNGAIGRYERGSWPSY